MTRSITISPVLNGWVVGVGCQSVVFQNRAEMLRELDRYYEDPSKLEREYLKNAVNRVGEAAIAQDARRSLTTNIVNDVCIPDPNPASPPAMQERRR